MQDDEMRVAWRMPLQGRTESNCDLRRSDLKVRVVFDVLGMALMLLILSAVVAAVVAMVVLVGGVWGGGVNRK